MKKPIALFVMVLFMNQIGFTSGDRTPAGGRSLAMGGTSVTTNDFWSLVNNQAGAAWLTGISSGIGFENRFLVRELAYEQVGFAMAMGAGTLGLTMIRFGNDQYRELKAGLCFARKFGKRFSVGVQFDYLHIHAGNDYGNKHLISCEIGLMYHAGQHLSIGVHLLNPVPVKITGHPAEQLPPIICIGLSYCFSRDFLTAIEVEKDLDNPLAFRAGAEYHFAGPAYARIGISTTPVSFTFGVGLEFNKLKFDIASGYHQALGFSPAGSIVYSFK
jgi:hypothetical protein